MISPLEIELFDDTQRLTEKQLAWLGKFAHSAIIHLGCGGSIRVRVINDDAMSKAHMDFLEDPTTTDVLTFDMSDQLPDLDPPSSDTVRTPKDRIVYGLDTDILVCFDVATRQAASRGYSVEKELLLYVVHGVLHCLGHDDHEEPAAAAMHATEDALLQAIGVGVAFATQPRVDGKVAAQD